MVYFIAGSACSDRLFKPYVHLEFLRKGSYRMDFKYEMVVPNEDLPCKFFIFEGKNGNYRRANHWHQSVEIFLVLEGELRFYINNQSQPLSAGELIIVNSNEIHSIEAPKAKSDSCSPDPGFLFCPLYGKRGLCCIYKPVPGEKPYSGHSY